MVIGTEMLVVMRILVVIGTKMLVVIGINMMVMWELGSQMVKRIWIRLGIRLMKVDRGGWCMVCPLYRKKEKRSIENRKIECPDCGGNSI